MIPRRTIPARGGTTLLGGKQVMQSPPPPPPPPGGMAPPPPPMGYVPAQGDAPAANYGGFWIRVVAYIIDGVIIGVAAGIIYPLLHIHLTDPQNPGPAPGS